MGLVLKYSQGIRGLFTGLKRLLQDISFKINEDNAILWGLDENKTTYVYVNIPKSIEAFDHEPTEKFGIDLTYFGKVLSRARRNSYIDLSYKEGKLFIEIFEGSIDERVKVKRFILPTISVEEMPSYFNLGFDVEINVDPKYFAEMIEVGKLDKSSSILKITADKDEEKLILESGSLDSLKYYGIINLYSDDYVFNYTIAKSSKSLYDLRTLQRALPLIKRAESLSIAFSSEKPLKIRATYNYEIESEIYIAPIIDGGEA